MLNKDEIEILWTTPFIKRWKSFGYKEQDKEELEEILTDNFDLYPIVQGTGGVRKLRFPLPGNKGKRGGSRICFYYSSNDGYRIYLLVVFSKQEKDNLSGKEKKMLKAIVKTLN
ncbi:MAG: type II toxin-antitoxin system RelE/ParE family toxin [Spirochaetales bacterium]|nr:type II toxin-antitoxin system RelE/ParE family toxin [Spirochaetales bacterium]